MVAIISNNCWGGGYYQENSLQYNTPTIGLWFYPSDYMRLLFQFRKRVNTPPEFIDGQRLFGVKYPVAMLGDGIKIMFMHYNSQDDARAKWSNRVSRLPENDDEIFVKICDRDGLTQDHLSEFAKTPFKNKIAIVKSGTFQKIQGLRMIEVDSDGASAPDGVKLWNMMRTTVDLDPIPLINGTS